MDVNYGVRLLICLLGLNLFLTSNLSAQDEERDRMRSLDANLQALKEEVIELNRELFVLEEELLFPANTQISVFVSVDSGSLFALDAVEVKMDERVVSHYLYTPRELDAMKRGGVHRVFTGNLKTGEHELVALVVGKGPSGRDYRRGARLVFHKDLGPKFVELRIDDDGARQQPVFGFREW